MEKLNICVLFGGVSSEHEISLITAKGIIDNLNRDKYNVYMLGITKIGQWLLFDGDTDALSSGKWAQHGKRAYISPDRSDGGIVTDGETISIDLVYLALHGEHGEDGTMQGLLKIAGIPYIGANTMSSALCMDKAMTKLVLKAYDIPMTDFVLIYKNDMNNIDSVVASVEGKFSYPVFVKPPNVGSSVGASKAKDREGLVAALNNAFKYDYKVMIEEYIDATEVECGVLGNRYVVTGSLARVVMDSEFYDYETKYTPGMTVNEIPAKVPDDIAEKIKALAKQIYLCLDVTGLGRVDFFVENETNRILFNELNTLPGFTPFSAYPGMFKDTGIEYSELLDKIIELGLT